MHLPASQDTPFHRASIKEIPIDELEERLEKLRVRRLASYTIYQAGQEAKQRAKDVKTAQQFEKACEQVAKLLETVDKNIEKLEKKVLDIQALRLIMGDDIGSVT